MKRSSCVCGNHLLKNASTVEKYLPWGALRFVKCWHCYSWVQSPQITMGSLKWWYDSDEYQAAKKVTAKEGIYLDYMAGETHRRIEAFARYHRDLAALISPGDRVLEVGCATGSLSAVLRREGYKVSCVDLSEKFAEGARILNDIEVEVADFLEVNYEPEFFDLIIMLGTISNLQDLHSHLLHANSLLNRDGILYFNFPAADSLVAKLYGKHFWMFTPSVSTFFSRKGMYLALRRTGFVILKSKLDRQRPSLSKLFGQAKIPFLYKMLKLYGIEGYAQPFALMIPGVRVVWAKKFGSLR